MLGGHAVWERAAEESGDSPEGASIPHWVAHFILKAEAVHYYFVRVARGSNLGFAALTLVSCGGWLKSRREMSQGNSARATIQ